MGRRYPNRYGNGATLDDQMRCLDARVDGS